MNIEVDVSVAFVNIYKSTGTVFEYELVESRKGLYIAKIENGKLTVTDGESSWTDRLNLAYSNKYGISIGIPEGHAIGLNIKADTSTVTIDGVELSGNTEIVVSSGAITLQGVSTDGYISNDITTGNVTFESVTCSEISADVDTGDIFARRVDAKKAISLTSGTGKITGLMPRPREEYRVSSSISTGASDLESGGSGDVELIVSVSTGAIAFSFPKA